MNKNLIGATDVYAFYNETLKLLMFSGCFLGYIKLLWWETCLFSSFMPKNKTHLKPGDHTWMR